MKTLTYLALILLVMLLMTGPASACDPVVGASFRANAFAGYQMPNCGVQPNFRFNAAAYSAVPVVSNFRFNAAAYSAAPVVSNFQFNASAGFYGQSYAPAFAPTIVVEQRGLFRSRVFVETPGVHVGGAVNQNVVIRRGGVGVFH